MVATGRVSVIIYHAGVSLLSLVFASTPPVSFSPQRDEKSGKSNKRHKLIILFISTNKTADTKAKEKLVLYRLIKCRLPDRLTFVIVKADRP